MEQAEARHPYSKREKPEEKEMMGPKQVQNLATQIPLDLKV